MQLLSRKSKRCLDCGDAAQQPAQQIGSSDHAFARLTAGTMASSATRAFALFAVRRPELFLRQFSFSGASKARSINSEPAGIADGGE